MTMTVKLDSALESRLRERSARSGRTSSELIREALTAYLGEPAGEATSAYALGLDLFERHAGSPGLAASRKAELASIWADKRRG